MATDFGKRVHGLSLPFVAAVGAVYSLVGLTYELLHKVPGDVVEPVMVGYPLCVCAVSTAWYARRAPERWQWLTVLHASLAAGLGLTVGMVAGFTADAMLRPRPVLDFSPLLCPSCAAPWGTVVDALAFGGFWAVLAAVLALPVGFLARSLPGPRAVSPPSAP